MGAFFVASGAVSGATCEKLDRAHRMHGFALAKKLEIGALALYLYRKLDGHGGLFIETPGNGFACLTGQLLYRGECGEKALRSYCADLANHTVAHDRVIGHFALLLNDRKGLRLCTDPMGFFHVYLDRATGLASSSFWALLELQPKVTVDPAGVYEYAWNGAGFGGKTFVREIRRLPAESEVVLGDGMRIEKRPRRASATETASSRPLEAYVDEHAERLRRLFGDLAAVFGDRLRVSFSSGYDSRLILAGLKAAGARPGLFVYGKGSDADVQIAEQIAVGEKLELKVVDKSRIAVEGNTAALQQQERDFVLFDAWKVDGIFDDGSDAIDRCSRHHDGLVPLNGSLGEIYRNFFYIPDRRLALKEVVESFFSCYAPAACTDGFDVGAYQDGLVRAFQAELGSSDERVSRAEVESLYPLVRGRYWAGRDATLNLRFGRMFFPFMQSQLIDGTAAVPVRFKNHGLLEARLIQRLDPAVAAYPSGYGYRFCDPPPLRHRAKSWTTLYRPPWLRRYSYRLRFSSHRRLPSYLASGHLGKLMDASMPYMRRYFRPERLHDPDAFNRIATMEYVFQRYGAEE